MTSSKNSHAASKAAWENPPDLQSLPFTEVLAAWDVLDDKGRYAAGVRTLCKKDRYYLLVKILGRVDVWHPWIYARCREVEASPDGHIDIWGREHYKSTIITFAGGIQEILKDPEITIGIFSHTKHLAKGFLGQIQRELEGNDKLKMLFPDILYDNPAKQSPSWSLDNGLIVKRTSNPKECTVEAWGLVDGQPTSKHFKLLDYDDVVTKESVATPEQIQKTTQAWELSDNLGVAGGRKWHVGTRYDFNDTYAAIISRGAAALRVHPATHDGTKEGRPVLLTQAQWNKKVIDQGEATIAAQMLCNPLAGSQRMFNVEDLGVYEVRPETLMAYITVDPARSNKKGTANTAMAVQGIDYAGNKYFLDGYDHKMDLTERWTRMRDLWAKWKVAPGIQGVSVGYEKFGAEADLDYFKERMSIERVNFEILELAWPRDGEGSKTDRVQRLNPDFKMGRYYLPYDFRVHVARDCDDHPCTNAMHWKVDETRLTKRQREMVDSGYGYRVAKPIKRKNENGEIYDLTERLRMQVAYFPFGLKDLIDTVSRVYDMEPVTPTVVDSSQLEPEIP